MRADPLVRVPRPLGAGLLDHGDVPPVRPAEDHPYRVERRLMHGGYEVVLAPLAVHVQDADGGAQGQVIRRRLREDRAQGSEVHHELHVLREVEVLPRRPGAGGRGHGGSPHHLHHAVVVVVMLRTDPGQYGVDVLQLVAGEIASEVDALDEPRRRRGLNAYDGGARVQVVDQHGGESERRADVDEQFALADKFGWQVVKPVQVVVAEFRWLIVEVVRLPPLVRRVQHPEHALRTLVAVGVPQVHLVPPQILLVLRGQLERLLDDVLGHLGPRRGPQVQELVPDLVDVAVRGGIGGGVGRFGKGESLGGDAEEVSRSDLEALVGRLGIVVVIAPVVVIEVVVVVAVAKPVDVVVGEVINQQPPPVHEVVQLLVPVEPLAVVRVVSVPVRGVPLGGELCGEIVDPSVAVKSAAVAAISEAVAAVSEVVASAVVAKVVAAAVVAEAPAAAAAVLLLEAGAVLRVGLLLVQNRVPLPLQLVLQRVAVQGGYYLQRDGVLLGVEGLGSDGDALPSPPTQQRLLAQPRPAQFVGQPGIDVAPARQGGGEDSRDQEYVREGDHDQEDRAGGYEEAVRGGELAEVGEAVDVGLELAEGGGARATDARAHVGSVDLNHDDDWAFACADLSP
mmetsp:Transcript_38519/g.82175  ORF Transcript_38519/g.82175 Transcript_38519/m.82175 type:complete len:623 (-) Transcript_38519:95-1963(-)